MIGIRNSIWPRKTLEPSVFKGSVDLWETLAPFDKVLSWACHLDIVDKQAHRHMHIHYVMMNVIG